MSATYTINAGLTVPDIDSAAWGATLNAMIVGLDALAPIRHFAVALTEVPSASLNVKVAPGVYLKADGTIGTYAGSTSTTLPASSTSYLWLTDAGVLAFGTAFPATPHVRVAQVVSGSATITGITDARVGYRTASTSPTYVLKAGDTMTGAFTVSTSGGVAVFSADPASALLAFFNATPAGPAPKITALTNSSGGVASNTISDSGSSYSQGVMNNNMATIVTTLNLLIAAVKRHGLMSST